MGLKTPDPWCNNDIGPWLLIKLFPHLQQKVKGEKMNKKIIIIILILIFSILIPGCGSNSDDDGGSSYPEYNELDISFDGVVLNHFADQTITLTNTGSANLPLEQLEGLDLPFTIELDECSESTLSPSESCDIRVRFQPTTQGPHYDVFVVPITGSDRDFVGVNLDGEGFGYNVSINQVDIVSCPEIQLFVSVTDSDNNLVTDLDVDNFYLRENDTEIQWSTDNTVSTGTVSYLSVILLIDISSSTSDDLASIKDAADAFIDDITDTSEVAIFVFDGDGAEEAAEGLGFVIADETGRNTLHSTVATISSSSGTNLYQAVLDVCAFMDNYAIGDERAIVLITDGEAISTEVTIDEAIAAAQSIDAPLFTIGFGVYSEYGTYVINQLAYDTGGLSFMEPDAGELDDVYLQVSNILTNQYVIRYSSNSSGPITLNVEVDDGLWVGEDTKESEGCP
jgi:uncharacterized protein YceK